MLWKKTVIWALGQDSIPELLEYEVEYYPHIGDVWFYSKHINDLIVSKYCCKLYLMSL
jgi:hypothetical protein